MNPVRKFYHYALYGQKYVYPLNNCLSNGVDHRLYRLVFTTFLFLLSSLISLYADTIILKNGSMIEGIVVADDGEKVTLSIQGGKIFIKHKEIESIIESEYIPGEISYEEPTEEIPVIKPPRLSGTITPTAVTTSTSKTTFAITDEGKTPEQIEINGLLRELLDNKTKEPWSIIRTLTEKGRKDIPYLIESVNNIKDQTLISWIIYTLGQIGDEQAIPPLIEKLTASEETLRSTAVKAIGHFNNAKIRSRLKSMLETETSGSVRSQIIDNFAGWQDPSIISTLLNLLGDEENQVRQSAASALVKFAQLASREPSRYSGTDIILFLIDKIKVPTPKASGVERKEIISVLGQVKDKRALGVLTKLLTDKDPETRSLSAMALGDMADKDTIDFLMGRLKEETDATTKIQIMQIFQKNPNYDMIPVLIETLQDPVEDVRLVAARVLRVITKRSFGANYEQWKKWWESRQGK